MKDSLSHLPVLFILCLGRSGSTLLQSILQAHPQIQAPFESKYFLFLFQKYARKTRWNSKDLNQFYEDLLKEDKFRKLWSVDHEHLKESILQEPLDTNFARLYKIVALSAKTSDTIKTDIQLISDKNPAYSLFIPEIKSVFPEAKILHLIRDPRDVALSHVKNLGARSLALGAQKWVLFNRRIEKEKQQNPIAFFTLRYEDFVAQPENYMEKISRFLAIDFDAESLQPQKRDTDLSHLPEDWIPRVQKIHRHVNKPISSKNIGKWKEQLSSEEIKKIEGICRPSIEFYDYRPQFSKGIPASLGEKLHYHFIITRLNIYYHSPLFLRKAYRKLLGLFFKPSTN